MFEQTFKNIDDILHKDAGCGSELDYVEQTSWILFLKYLDDLEKVRATSAVLTGKAYTPIIDPEYQRSIWATPKDAEGRPDHHRALTGDDLTVFVNNQLFRYCDKFKLLAQVAIRSNIRLEIYLANAVVSPGEIVSGSSIRQNTGQEILQSSCVCSHNQEQTWNVVCDRPDVSG